MTQKQVLRFEMSAQCASGQQREGGGASAVVQGACVGLCGYFSHGWVFWFRRLYFCGALPRGYLVGTADSRVRQSSCVCVVVFLGGGCRFGVCLSLCGLGRTAFIFLMSLLRCSPGVSPGSPYERLCESLEIAVERPALGHLLAPGDARRPHPR